MEKNHNLVLAVLLNYNQNDYTISCVNSILKSDYENFQILLIDNGSANANFESLKRSLPEDNKLLLKRLEKNIGYSKGSNYGFEEGVKLKPHYFLILNNDTIIDPQAISALVETSKLYNDMARVSGKVFHYDQPNMLQFIGFEHSGKIMVKTNRFGVDELDEGQYDEIMELDMMEDIFVLHPVKLYESIGGYSPYLWINGVNVDISLRAIKEGYKLIFCPKAKLWHKGSVSIGGRNMNPKLAFWNIQSKLIIRYLNWNLIHFGLFYIATILSSIRTIVKAIIYKVLGKEDIFKYALAKFHAIFYFNKWVFKKNENDGYSPY